VTHRLAPWAVTAALVAMLLPARATAGGIEVSGGAAYWTESSSAFSVTLGKFWDLPGFQLGVRTGFAYVTAPNSGGIPADVVARFGLGTFYLEGQAGAWFLFTRDPVVRFHATGGGGLDLGIVRLGVEAGYLKAGALFGARVSLAL
jgi:hypothetical protein